MTEQVACELPEGGTALGVGKQIPRYCRGELGRDLSEKTVRYKPRSPMPTKLDPYEDLILTRLQEFPKLTAVRLFQEAKVAGYPGGYT